MVFFLEPIIYEETCLKYDWAVWCVRSSQTCLVGERRRSEGDVVYTSGINNFLILKALNSSTIYNVSYTPESSCQDKPRRVAHEYYSGRVGPQLPLFIECSWYLDKATVTVIVSTGSRKRWCVVFSADISWTGPSYRAGNQWTASTEVGVSVKGVRIDSLCHVWGEMYGVRVT